MSQDPQAGPTGGISVDSDEVVAGGQIEVVVADGSGTIEVLISGTVGSQKIPVPPDGIVTIPVPPVEPGTVIVISNGGVSGSSSKVTVVPRSSQ